MGMAFECMVEAKLSCLLGDEEFMAGVSSALIITFEAQHGVLQTPKYVITETVPQG